MAIFVPLTIGRDALLAHQRAVQTTGQNIANVNSPGYSRQRIVLAAVPPASDGSGGGVRAVAVEQAVDRFLEARRLASGSALAAATTSRDLLDQVQGLFPVQGPGIGDALQGFFAAANALATHPEDLAVRSDLLTAADTLATRLRGVAGDLATLQRDADNRVAQEAQDANVALTTIAGLNRSIVAAEIGGGSANELRDARRQALGELAQALDVHVIEMEDGSVNVYGATGAPLVVGGDAVTLATQPDGSNLGLDGAALSTLGWRNGAALISLGPGVGGRLGALLTLRDQTLPQNGASLDLLATTARDAVNAVQTDPAGRDLDGLVGAPLLGGTGAADLAVTLTDPRGIAAARSTNAGDNTNALALAALGDTTFPALGGATLGDFFGTVQATVGNQARGAADETAITENIASALDAQRDAISGVSLEEEFTDLIRFQRGFQAAAQLISTSDRMLDDLFSVVRS